MIKILAWLLLIIFSPWLLVIGGVYCVLSFISKTISEMIRIIDYQIIPYIKWKVKIVRDSFRKKDS